MTITIARRKFIAALGGTAFVWPFAARAQQPERMRRIGVLMTPAENDPDVRSGVEVFRQGLHELGWSEGRNLQIDYRWGGGDVGRSTTPGDPLHPHRVPDGYRPGRPRLCREPGASGRQYNRLSGIRVLTGHQVDGDSQTDCAQPRTSRHHLQSGDGTLLPTVLTHD